MSTSTPVRSDHTASATGFGVLGEAAAMQRALMPAPVYTGTFVQAAAATRPRRAIGGDFYDYRDIGSEFHFLVGDVCGSGTPAALEAALVQGILAVQIEANASAARVVTHLNRALCRRCLPERFVTLFYGVMRRDHCFTYCNAGHCHPMLLGRSVIRRLSVGGVPPGLFVDAVYEEESVLIESGATLVAFSDGVAEAGAPDREFGDERILEIVSENRSASAMTIRNRLMTTVSDYAHGCRRDDMTVLVVRYLA